MRLVPALVLPGDEDADTRYAKIVPLHGNARLTLGDFPEPPAVTGKKRKRDAAFRRAFNASGLGLLHDTIERVHGATLQVREEAPSLLHHVVRAELRGVH